MFLSGLISAILISGCAIKEEEQLYTKSEAEQKFIQICKNEYNWNVNTAYVGSALWIYIPFDEDILKFKVNKFPQINRFSVGFLNGEYTKETFQFEYQITPLAKSEEDRGFTYSLTDKVSQDFHHLLQTIQRVFFNAEEEQQPEFYVLVLADIVNGVEAKYTIYALDLKKAFSYALPWEEYYKRILQDMRGDLAIIHDKTGRHLTYEEITLGQFLAKQIVQRIRLRFLSMDFKLTGTIEEEILEIISYCLGTYEFIDYLMVVLNDLTTEGKTITYRLDIEETTEL
ncbi:MAG: hypothetical protein PVI33_00815 [Candidatus Omnitrophota bacterium]|jgi:hypothetical protein